jgi:acyl-CoA synthetase (AMP-forming)/AMP-acid ligase II
MVDRQSDPMTLMKLLLRGAGVARSMRTRNGSLNFDDFLSLSSFCGRLGELVGRSVALMTDDQLKTATALIELDGVARRILLCPPDLESKYRDGVLRDAEVDAIVYDEERGLPVSIDVALATACAFPLRPQPGVIRRRATEWVLLTSGTNGPPKAVVHSLASLTAAFLSEELRESIENWATFYDIRRYGGLQIFLRTVAGRGSLTLRDRSETIEDFVSRGVAENVTHISGTPSHWRFALMNPSAARELDPEYVRLSGEIADRPVIDMLKALYARARIVVAYASTEAGVAFEVTDGEEGFPEQILGDENGDVVMKLVEGALRVRSNRTAIRYLGVSVHPLLDEGGFVDTGDMIVVNGGRCFFAGRRGGTINVGGAKVNPEEVEAVINRHPRVSVSRVKGRKNPLVGAVVVADIELKKGEVGSSELKQEIIASCAAELAFYKVPALLNFVPSLGISAGGKLARDG